MCARPACGSIAGMIEVRELTKDYGDKRAVNRRSFTAYPGVVTGFLGPNDSGKSVTMRILPGMDAPAAHAALVNGRRYTTINRPIHTVGALFAAGAAARRNSCKCLMRSNGIDWRRRAGSDGGGRLP
jgi:ABC-2 type transport system ATP-binding protein